MHDIAPLADYAGMQFAGGELHLQSLGGKKKGGGKKKKTFLLLEETLGKGIKIVVLPVHHCCPRWGFANARGWIRQTQNCNGNWRKLQRPREGGTWAPHSGSGWQLGLLALHPRGQSKVTATRADPPARLPNLHFLGVTFFFFILWITKEGNSCCPSCKGVSGS